MVRMLTAAAICAATLPFATAALADEPPAALRTTLEKVVKDDGAPGVTAIVFKDGKRLYRLDVGDIAPDAELPVASASKWMTATLVMTLVDEGKLALDEPIGRRLPQLTGPVAEITLRQLMSFTSGQGSLLPMTDLKQDARMPLAESAAAIAARPLEDPPGKVFKYGSGAMQIAGWLVESASGKSWAALFDERIARPLGLAHTHWGNPLQPGVPAAEVRNPNLQAGVFTTAEDYGRFLQMIAGRGVYDGHRILSEKAFAAMEEAQTQKVDMAWTPPGAPPDAAYAIGHWCEGVKADGHCALASSPGAFGTYPWVDWATGYSGVFFLKHRLPLVSKDLREARQEIIAGSAR